MKNCWQPGWTAWVLDSENDKRKYRYTWVISENEQGELIGINTNFANKIVYEALLQGDIKELDKFEDIKTEVKYGKENSRIDIFLIDKNQQKTFIEVKSVTLLEENGQGYFPDSVTERGQKHLRELIDCVKQGNRAVLFFLVQHTGIKKVSPAAHIDPEYAKLFKQAIDAGVEVLAYACEISPQEIKLTKKLLVVSG